MTDLLALESGMDVLPRTPAHGPYHHNNLVHHHHNYHHHTDQTKSLQELQNEVGALLEFRDLVIETFPDLKHKMASSSANSTITGLQSSSIVSRREWEPGIRVRRKLNSNYSKEGSSSSGGEIQSSSLLTRSRSNSHSGKKEPKSGEGNGSVIQDSGFSTETSSSKEAHSASSTAGSAGVQGNNISSALTARLTSDPTSSNSDNELWNLLDVIHRRTSRLADESDQKFNNNSNRQSSTTVTSSSSFQSQLNYMKKDDVQILRKERDHLMDKMGDMEAEVLASRIKESKLQDLLNEMRQTKADLEAQLKFALSQKSELSRLRDINLFVDDSQNSQNDNKLNRPKTEDVVISPIVKNLTSSSSSSSSSTTTFQPIPIKPQLTNKEFHKSSINDDNLTLSTSSSSVVKQMKDELNAIGRLDGLISNPNSKLNKIRVPDSKKIAAILLETNIIELQRHLLTITVQNQVLQQKLDQATKSKILLIKKLDKSKEDVEDLKFTIEERNIELEGTRAQIRVMEAKLLAARCDGSPEHQSSSSSTTTRLSRDGITVMHTSTPNQRLIQSTTTISTPSMKAMIPFAMDDLFQHSSSTESAHDQQERDMTASKCPETPRRTKPSKIPLPGSTKSAVNVSTKPPSGRAISAGPPSANRSLTKSTSSLYTASGIRTSGPSSITKRDLSLNRPDSVQSLRNSNSIDGNKTSQQQQPNRSSSSSIPISQSSSSTNISNKLVTTASPTLTAAYGNTTVVNIPPSSPNKYVTSSPSPVLRPKRDSLTTRVKNLDSLSRLQSSSSSCTLSANGNSGSATTTLRLNNNSNSNNNQNVVTNGTNNNNSNRKYTALPVRRMSNVSVRDANTIDHHIHHHNDSNSSTNGNSDANGGKVHYLNLKYNNDNVHNNNNNKHVQSNVMKKSWTTSSITSALELEVENARKEIVAPIQFGSRDLIREYLQKSIVKVPEILKPQQNCQQQQQCHNETFSASVNEIDLAYKHPMVIAEELGHDGGEALAFDSLKKIGSGTDNSSIIIPQYKPEIRKNTERPHLIGKVTPSIARTWEQLSSTMDHYSGYEKQDEEDKQSYVLFVRKPFNFNASDSHENEFAVNKIHHLAESEKFYDSIEEYDDDYEEEIDDVDCNLDYDDENMTCGGEMMADVIDSLEMRRSACRSGMDDVIVWSIES
ncbi:putative uncharacterized protein DDB_G0277255 isoform X2 [Chironomus tepperi]